ncbi:MAG TPA: helical backbone metal receptor [Polyangiaceae bacterium]|nr:helical backbone metal receptor [Polyangiaceae bacterium]
MRRRPFLSWLGASALCAVALACRDAERQAPPKATAQRLVSLAPAVSETLFAIGAGPSVVAVSDYCDSPEEVQRLPRLGSSITPNYEAIARLSPTLILGESNASSRRRELEALAPTRLLPWLTLQEIAASVRELGHLTRRESSANALSASLLRRLDVPAPSSGPRVLLVLGGEGGDASDIWFIRRNSLHGAALHAAGARNAVDEDVHGPPQLSQERLLSLDPDAIVVLTRLPRNAAPTGVPAATSSPFQRFTTLRAVQQRRLAVLQAPEAFANDPRILRLVDLLRAQLVGLGVLAR